MSNADPFLRRAAVEALGRHPHASNVQPLAAMLIMPDESAGPGMRIGASCRVCARGDCPARREPSILAAEGG